MLHALPLGRMGVASACGPPVDPLALVEGLQGAPLLYNHTAHVTKGEMYVYGGQVLAFHAHGHYPTKCIRPHSPEANHTDVGVGRGSRGGRGDDMGMTTRINVL